MRSVSDRPPAAIERFLASPLMQLPIMQGPIPLIAVTVAITLFAVRYFVRVAYAAG